jgi:hypothetical protein
MSENEVNTHWKEIVNICKKTKFLEIVIEYTGCRQAVSCWTLHNNDVDSEFYCLASCLIHDCTHFMCKLAMTIFFFFLATAFGTYVSTVWSLLKMTPLTPIMLNWLRDFWRICVLRLQYMTADGAV